MSFAELLAQLPNCPGKPQFPVASTLGGLRYVAAQLPEFVGPDLAPSSAIDQPTEPRVLIISAAGAVGKSTLARELAFAKSSPLWDLAQAATVGGGAMTGQLTSAFGFAHLGNVSRAIT